MASEATSVSGFPANCADRIVIADEARIDWPARGGAAGRFHEGAERERERAGRTHVSAERKRSSAEVQSVSRTQLPPRRTQLRRDEQPTVRPAARDEMLGAREALADEVLPAA